MAQIGKNTALARMLLTQGEVVAIPTETVYGLAGNAHDPKAIQKIFSIKNRPTTHPLIIHIASIDQLSAYVNEIPTTAQKLAQTCWPGPLTLLLPKKATISEAVTAGKDYVAIRIPDHPITLKLLASLSFPLAAPSANPFGYISPTQASHVDDQLGDKIPYILDGGPCKVGIESTIIGFEGAQPIIYRFGGVTGEQIHDITGMIPTTYHPLPSDVAGEPSPGLSLHHYAPAKPLYIGHLPTLAALHTGKKLGVLAFDQYYPGIPETQQVVLSPQGSLVEAAYQLFNALRTLDNLGIDGIIASYLPPMGLGRAINDRLWRASDKAQNCLNPFPNIKPIPI